MSSKTGSDIYERPVELLQNLLRFDTTNPPGNEAECIHYVDGLFRDAGIETVIAGAVDERPNLIARLKGRGEAPPLLMHGHVDVVTTANQVWKHDPFGGKIIDGEVWGRGALDMKGAVANMICALLRAKAEGFVPAGDIILAVVADEEQGGDFGARWLVQNRPELFEGVKYSIGEAGGETTYVAGKKFYPIQVGEKQICRIKATFRGTGGHGSIPRRGGSMAKLGRFLTAIDQQRLPVHITPVVERMLTEMSAEMPEALRSALGGLLNPATTDAVLDGMGLIGRLVDPLLHNTVSPTIVQGGHAVNVIPSELTLMLDGRLLPGHTPETAIPELRAVVGDDVELEVTRFDSYPTEIDMSLYEMMAQIMREADPEGTPVPYILTGVTDGRHFAQLGIQNYGFTPLKLPDDESLIGTVHDSDERVPVDAMQFGADCMYKLVQRYGG